MKTFYALIHLSNNTIIGYYPYASRQEDGSILLKEEQPEQDKLLDEEGNPILIDSVINYNSNLVKIVEVEFNEKTSTILSAKEEDNDTIIELNIILDKELSWYLNNNGLIWENQKLIKK